MGSNVDTLIAWAQSLLPGEPAAADANKKAKANWAATPPTEQRALALRFFEGESVVQTAAGEPEKANLRGQLDPPRDQVNPGTALLSENPTSTTSKVVSKDKAANRKASRPS